MSARWYVALAAVAISAPIAVAGAGTTGPGDLDPTFGVGGRAIFTPGVESWANAATIDGGGTKIVLAGFVGDFLPPPPPSGLARDQSDFTPPPRTAPAGGDYGDFLAMRLTADGAPDGSFGANGVVRTPINLRPNGFDEARSIAVDPDGRIVLGGSADLGGGPSDLAFARYTSNGALDPSFSGDGIQTLNVSDSDSISGVAVQPDGKVIAVGSAGTGFLVVRFQVNGELDGTFGSGGIVDTTLGDPSSADAAAAVALQADGKIVVAGAADVVPWPNGDLAVVRYLPNGQLDPSFGSGGIVITHGPVGEIAHALALAPGGKIVLCGNPNDFSGFLLVRYLSTGSLDATFGGTGVVKTPLVGGLDQGRAVAVQPGGRIVAGGDTSIPGSYRSEFAIARYKDDGSLDETFGSGGVQLYDAFEESRSSLGGYALVVQPGAGSQRPSDRLIQAGLAYDTTTHVAAIGVDGGLPLAPPPPPPPPLPPPPSPALGRCRVPRVVHRRLAVARSRIKRAHCSVGRVRRVRSRRFRGLVVAQSPRAGRRLARGARVNLVVGRR